MSESGVSDRRTHRGPITQSRVAAAVEARALVHALVGRDADDATFDEVRALLARANARLAEAPRLPRPVPDFSGYDAMDGQLVEVDRIGEPIIHAMADRAVAGPANPTSVEMRTWIVDGGAEADVEFGAAFEGAPGRVHGGVVAAVFDDLVGAAMAQARSPGFTGRLTVHYRAPTPIERPVRFRAWLGSRDGRKLHVHGDARLDDTVLATADAIMVLVDLDHFRTQAGDLLARRVEGD